MCMTGRSRSYGAGAALEPDGSDLPMLAALLWDSVARIADGVAPDEKDCAILEFAADMLKGQAQTIRYVRSNAAAAEPEYTPVGVESFVDVIWRAFNQLPVDMDVAHDPVERIESFAKALLDIGNGDREKAQKYDKLLQRISVLTEQLTAEAGESVLL